jgi:hypothetical protein
MSALQNTSEKGEGRRKMNKRKILLPATTRHVEACAYKCIQMPYYEFQTYDVCSYAICNLLTLLC